MAPAAHDTRTAGLSQDDFQAYVRSELREAVRLALLSVLEAEVEALIGAERYARSPLRRDRRTGHYTRALDTSVGRIADLAVPRTRRGHQTQVFARYHRRRPELDQAIGEMFIRGVSTQGVGQVLEQLNDTKPSASTVSRVFHTLETEFQAWKTRPLAAHYVYAFADGTYFSVIYNAEGCKMPVLALIGIRPDGVREVLAFRVGDRENQAAWTDLLVDLKTRGVQQVDLWITDGQQAMLNALAVQFPNTPRQRCIQHKMQNVLAYIPKQQHDLIEPELKALFYQPNRAAADQAVEAFCAKHARVYPTAIECLRRDLEACLAFYAFPAGHWRTMRTTNVIERLFEEVKRRSHKMGAAFRTEDSCLLMFYAVVRGLHFNKVHMPN